LVMVVRHLILLSLLACFFVPRTSQASVALTDENWDETLKTQSSWIINLFVPWCEYSRELTVEWKKLSDSPPSGVSVGHVDCSENYLCDKLFLDGFPTIIFVEKNRFTEYPGERNSASIKEWITNQKFKQGTSKFVPRMTIVEPLISDVVVLTDRNFDKKVLAASEPWLIEFYAPWCGHCKNLAPVWEEVAHELKGIANVAKLDCTTEKAIAERFGIGAYPTIKMVRDGKVYDYKASRNKEEFFAFVDSTWQQEEAQDYPVKEEEFELPTGVDSSVIVLTTKNFDENIREGVWLIEFYAPWCGHCQQLVPVWEELAYKHSKEFNVAKVDATEETELADRFEIDGFPMVKLVRDGKMFDYAGPRKVKDYVSFVRSGYKQVDPEPLHREVFKVPEGESRVIVLTDKNFDSELKASANAQWLIEFYAPWCGHCKKLVPAWEELAYRFSDDSLKVAKVDATVETATAARFGVQSYPTIFMVRGDSYFLYQGARKVKDFADFAKSQGQGATALPLPAANAVPKSAELEAPEASGDSKVVVLTDNNFYESIAKGTWLVKFYAPWCGHCKNLVPTWETLAKKHSGSFNVAKLDATVETKTAATFHVQGYPTLLLFKDGKSWSYEGSRSESDLANFALRSHADQPGTPLPAPPRQYLSPPEGVSKVVVLTDKNFESTVKKGKWFIEFYAPWCGHCKNLVPIWEQLAYNFEKINVAKVDATVETGLASRFNVQSFPTLKLIYNKQVYDYTSHSRDVDSLANWATDGFRNSESSPLKGTTRNEKSNVVVLRESNFDRKLSEGTWFVKFFAPWCGHCKSMAPTWDQLSSDVSSFVVADVDATVEKDLAKRFQIKGFPTLKLFKDGKMYDYNGDRSYDSLRAFGEGGYQDVEGVPIPDAAKKNMKRIKEDFI